MVASTPANVILFTLLRLFPVIVTSVPVDPELGVMPVIVGTEEPDEEEDEVLFGSTQVTFSVIIGGFPL